MDAPVGDATAGWAFMPAPMPVMPAQQFALVPQQQQPQQPERHWPASWPPAGGVGLLAGASAQHSHLPPVAPSQPGYWMLVPGHQPTEAAAPYTGQQAAPAAAPPLPRPSSGKRSGAAAAAGKGARRAQPGGISRAQTRLLQRRQRELDQGVIKGLEHQLGSLREQLQSLGIENQQLKQRQAALDATLEMQQKLQAAAAEARAASDLGTASDLGDEAASFSLDLAPSMAEGGAADTDAGDGGSIMDDADVDSLLADLAASAEDRSAGSGGALAAGAAGPAGDHSVPSGPVTRSTWFFSASLRQHVLWYQGQVCRLVELLAVLERIPPRLRRSLEDYKLHEETMEALAGMLSHIDDWTVHMAALRPVDFGCVLHNDLQQLLEGSSGGHGRRPGHGSAAAAAAWAAADAQGERHGEASIWQGLVAALALTPQQEQTLEAHQALFEQRAAALQDSKDAVLAALGEAAAKGNGLNAALDMLQVSEALRASLQEDMLVKAPVMISLRKVLTPLQMARLIVGCWPFYSTMRNVSRAHKQRRLVAAHTWQP